MHRLVGLSIALFLAITACSADGPTSEEVVAKKEAMAHEKGQKIDLAAQFEKLGVKELGRVKVYLSNQGIADDQMEGALKALVKVIYAHKKQGADFEPHPKLVEYMEQDVGLNGEQMQAVFNMGRRLSKSKGHARQKAPLEERYAKYGITDLTDIRDQLTDSGISEDQLDAVMGAMLRIIHRLNGDISAVEMHPRLRMYFSDKLQLTDDQIEKVEAIAFELSTAEK